MDSTPTVPSLSDHVNPMLKPLKKFYLGEPLALGITQIFVGIFGIVLGIMMDISLPHRYREYYFMLKTPYWTGILYIISGSLSVEACRKPKVSRVKAVLGMNVVSTVAAGIAILILSISFATHYPPPEAITIAIEAVLLFFTVVEFCITISTAAFGCKAVCRDTYAETIVVVYQNVTPGHAVSQPAACKDPKTT